MHTIDATTSRSYVAKYEATTPLDEGRTTAPPIGVTLPPPPKSAPPPRTLLHGHPATKTHARRARFTFGAGESGASFRCKLNRAPYDPCQSPARYRDLKPGSYVFRVFAIDRQGKADSTPAKFSWRVLPPR